MKLLDFMPGIAQNTQVRFKEAIYTLVCYTSSRQVYVDTYLVIYSDGKMDVRRWQRIKGDNHPYVVADKRRYRLDSFMRF